MSKRTNQSYQFVGNATEEVTYQIVIEKYEYEGKTHWAIYKGDTLMDSAFSDEEAFEKAKDLQEVVGNKHRTEINHNLPAERPELSVF